MSTAFLVVLLTLLFLWWFLTVSRKGRGCGDGADGLSGRRGRASASQAVPRVRFVDSAVDPVCQMTLDKETADRTAAYHGQTYYFCSDQCYQAFAAQPKTYLARQSSPT